MIHVICTPGWMPRGGRTEVMIESDGELLLKRILQDREDNHVRLVYADWLEENGQSARVEFIRVQIEFEGTVCQRADPDERSDPYLVYCNSTECHHCSLSYRADELLGAITAARIGVAFCEPEASWVGEPLRTIYYKDGEDDYPTWWWRRGFVYKACCSWPYWAEHHEAILARHPIEMVQLTGWPWLIEVWGEASDVPLITQAFRLADGANNGFGEPFPLQLVDESMPGKNRRDRLSRCLLRQQWPRISFFLPGEEDQGTD